jgi:endoglucanase
MGYLHHGATWGPFQGVSTPATDWRHAAELAGNAILKVNPHVLIIVEGVQIYPYRNPLAGPFCPYHIPATQDYCADIYWWGGNLAGVKEYPIVLSVAHQLVYSAHEYGPRMHGQRWISPTMTERDWQQKMYEHWGYLLDATGRNAAPVWIGEFGTFNYSDRGVHDQTGGSQGEWFSALIHYLQRYPSVGWAYWPLNGTVPNDASGPGPERTETYGLLTRDWAHLSRSSLLRALRTIQ